MTRAEVLAIGDELVHGNALDTNSKHIARELEAAGLQVQRFTVATDEPEDLQRAMGEACARSRVLVATGGMGPTEDDRTREVAAALGGVPLELHEPSLEWLREIHRRRNRKMPASNRRQAYLPRGATVLPNPVGTAPGFRLPVGDCTLFVLPGVPREMVVMLSEQVLPWIQQNVPGTRPVAAYNLQVLGLTEAALGERIEAFMRHDREPRVGVTAHYGLMTIRVVGNGPTAEAALQACRETADQIRPHIEDVLACEGHERLLDQVGHLLIDQQLTVATAESCTGGLLASQLTDVPGISAVFLGGFVTYSDGAKVRDLAVPAELIEAHGAVSEPVAAAMAAGAAERSGARLAVGITGIAGPGGGSADKPVGTVCFGLCRDGATRAWTLRMGDLGRTFIRERSVLEGLVAMLREATSAGS